MSAAHPWLEPANWPTKQLPREELERRIERVLTLTNIGYLGTLGNRGPIVSPVEFYAEGLTVYVFPQPNSPKLTAMRRDPRISFAVANPMAGWASAWGVQMFGTADLLEAGTAEYDHGMSVFKWPASYWEVGRPLDSGPPPAGTLLRLIPDRITMTEHFLRRDGYGPRQRWQRDSGSVAAGRPAAD
jgi:Pyridoxamine 5'-phosphate oxidase